MEKATITFPIFGEGFSLSMSNYFTIFGFKVYFYGLIIGVGFLLAVIYVMRRADEFGLTQDNVLDFLLFAVPLAIICARLFFCVFYSSPSTNPYFKEPLRIITGIRSGGLAIYGGVIGAVLGAFICSKVRKLDFWSFADLGGLGLLIGQAVGRWGNFVNRELYGHETTVPWRMGLTTEAGTIYVHPTFFYESLWNTVGFILLHIYSKRVGRQYKGQLFVLYLGWYGLGRAWIESVRIPDANLFLFGTGIQVNQLIAVLCVVGAVVANIVFLRRGGSGGDGGKPKTAKKRG